VSAISRAELRDEVERLFTPAARVGAGAGWVGVELELVPYRRGPGRTREPVPLPALVESIETAAIETGIARVRADRPSFEVEGQGSLTFEPGGQLEYSGPPRPTARAAGADLRRVLGPLRRSLRAAGIELEDVGIADSSYLDEIQLQQPGVRYEVMDQYLSNVGPWGRRMMRGTASMQINLDFGPPERTHNVWRAANLLVPVLGGAFANSRMATPDGTSAASGRLWLWSRIEPGRTGFVLSARGQGPIDAYLDFALAAGVMLRGSGSSLRAGDGRSFAEWIAEPVDGEPNIEDWRTHLTTLFPHVRPRTWFEVRFVDTPREEWWDVPLVVLPALVYDDEATAAVIDLLSPLEPSLGSLTDTAAMEGAADPQIGGLAASVFRIALDAVDRMPTDYFGAAQVSATAEFLSRFISRRRSQADAPARLNG